MKELTEFELHEVNGGGILGGVCGAIVGTVVGSFVGAVGCTVTYFACKNSGENRHDSGKAALAVFGSCMATSASLGFIGGFSSTAFI